MPPTPRPPGAGPGTGATLVHTAHLGPDVRRAARDLVDRAFGGGFADEDWGHALGGLHALVHEGGDLVAHGAVVARHLLHGDRTLRVGYVEAVAVHPDRRRRGHASSVMAALEEVVRDGYDAGGLSAAPTSVALYAARGWQQWRGATWALTPAGRVRTPEDDDAVFVLPSGVALDLAGDLTCDWRAGDLW